jgi:hypothetical protein
MKITRIVSVLGMLGVAVSALEGCSSSVTDVDETAGALAGGSCTPGGLYCGGDVVSGDRKVLYRCDVKPFTSEDGEAPHYEAVAVETCNAECVVNPGGTRDTCKATHSLEEATALVKRFYGQIESRSQKETEPQNSTEAYDRSLLTPELDGFNETTLTWVPGSNAPFVCAQGEEFRFDVGAAVRDRENAVVPVNGGKISVTVRLSDLRIAGWRCGTPTHTSAQARGAVRKFYETYATDPGDPLKVKRPDWRTSAMMSAGLAQKLDEYGNTTHADPVLCAQDFPLGVSVDPPVEMGDNVAMTVRERFYEIIKVTTVVSLSDLKFGTIGCDGGDGPWAYKDGM